MPFHIGNVNYSDSFLFYNNNNNNNNNDNNNNLGCYYAHFCIPMALHGDKKNSLCDTLCVKLKHKNQLKNFLNKNALSFVLNKATLSAFFTYSVIAFHNYSMYCIHYFVRTVL